MIRVCIDDLAFLEAEAIVRPVNEDLGAPTPLLRRLELAAGTQLYNQIRLHEPLPVGAATVTAAGELHADLLVHAVVSGRTEPVSRDSVRRALTSALQRIEAWKIREIAIPPFGLGAGNLAIEDSAEIMLSVIGQHLRHASFPETVTLVAETPDEERALTAAVARSAA